MPAAASAVAEVAVAVARDLPCRVRRSRAGRRRRCRRTRCGRRVGRETGWWVLSWCDLSLLVELMVVSAMPSRPTLHAAARSACSGKRSASSRVTIPWANAHAARALSMSPPTASRSGSTARSSSPPGVRLRGRGWSFMSAVEVRVFAEPTIGTPLQSRRAGRPQLATTFSNASACCSRASATRAISNSRLSANVFVEGWGLDAELGGDGTHREAVPCRLARGACPAASMISSRRLMAGQPRAWRLVHGWFGGAPSRVCSRSSSRYSANSVSYIG